MRKIAFVSIFILLSLASFAQNGTATAMRGVIPGGYNFWLYTPENYKDTVGSQLPLIIFLHGKSLSGSDLNRVRRYGPIHAVERNKHIPAIIAAPQVSGSWNPSKVLDVLNYVVRNYDVDTNRIYVVGMSLGGFGTLDFVGSYPDKVAAAMAFCGGTTLKSYGRLSEVPLWIVHGTGDRAVSVEKSRRIVETLRRDYSDSLLIYTEIPGMGHGAPAKLFYSDVVYEWLFSHSRADSCRKVNRNLEISQATLNNAYDGLTFGNKQFVRIVDRQKGTSASGGIASKDTLSAGSAAGVRGGGTVHIVRKGDTLSGIAAKYGTTVSKLCSLNGISRKSLLRLGQRIKLD
jgi:predicted esterase